jgi:hypothetical protein
VASNVYTAPRRPSNHCLSCIIAMLGMADNTVIVNLRSEDIKLVSS